MTPPSFHMNPTPNKTSAANNVSDVHGNVNTCQSVNNQAGAGHSFAAPAGSTARVCAQCDDILKPEYPYAVCERCDLQNMVEADDDCDVCDRCGGDGVIEYLDAGPSVWGEDCPSEMNHLIPCPQCSGR